MPKHLSAFYISMVLICSCKEEINRQAADTSKRLPKQIIQIPIDNDDSVKAKIKSNLDFFDDSLLKGGSTIMRTYITKYHLDSCRMTTYNDSILKADFEGINVIGGIRSGKKTDSVFVVPAFNYCEEGESYCFYDKTLPRLYTESVCCHPHNLFVLQDIDEDGMREIGIYYSSCASRFKVLKIYSLKHGEWKQIGDSYFDTWMQDPTKVQFEKLVRKVAKGRFKICNFYEGETKWETITMK